MNYNQTKGKEGEEIAVQFLAEKGFTILHQNYKHGRNEVDIIAESDKFLVFVEVKFRTGTFFGYPENAISNQQKKNIVKVATYYLDKAPTKKLVRFDIISITNNQRHIEVSHFEDSFY